MRRALVITSTLLASLASQSARADDAKDAAPKETWSQPWYARMVVGVGGLMDVPATDLVLTAEIGHRPFQGALATGGSFSSASDLAGSWAAITLGAFAKLDLTYLFLSGLWSKQPAPSTPIRVQLGSRIGITASDSFGLTPLYTLVRAEMEPFLDLEFPLDAKHTYGFVFRSALDTSVSFNAVFRWSFAIGFSYGWGHV
jgi:hypothetical protein